MEKKNSVCPAAAQGPSVILTWPIITALAPVKVQLKKKVQLTWSSWGRSSEVRCVLGCSIGESLHRIPSVNQPLAWVCVSLASRPELRTYKETVCLLPEPGLHRICTRFLQFPDECSGLSCWAGQRRPDPTPCQWSEGRCPASRLATCLCSSAPSLSWCR